MKNISLALALMLALMLALVLVSTSALAGEKKAYDTKPAEGEVQLALALVKYSRDQGPWDSAKPFGKCVQTSLRRQKRYGDYHLMIYLSELLPEPRVHDLTIVFMLYGRDDEVINKFTVYGAELDIDSVADLEKYIHPTGDGYDSLCERVTASTMTFVSVGEKKVNHGGGGAP